MNLVDTLDFTEFNAKALAYAFDPLIEGERTFDCYVLVLISLQVKCTP